MARDEAAAIVTATVNFARVNFAHVRLPVVTFRAREKDPDLRQRLASAYSNGTDFLAAREIGGIALSA
jgi:hypothetical protein